MPIKFEPAQRRKQKCKLMLTGPSGSGKTMSALAIASGLEPDWKKIALADTEHGRGELYVGAEVEKTATNDGFKIGAYQVAAIAEPYESEKYIEVIDAAEKAGFTVLVIDSMSHAWSGAGGLLDQKSRMDAQDSSKGFLNWDSIGRKQNKLIERIMASPLHIIATTRTKQAYAFEVNEKGKTVPKKVGLAPIQRDGLEYEFLLVLYLDRARAWADKDNTNMFKGVEFQPTPKTGEMLLTWLNSGIDAPLQKVEPELKGAKPCPTCKARSKLVGEDDVGGVKVGIYNCEICKKEWRMKL
jgi:hypothetical protein